MRFGGKSDETKKGDDAPKNSDKSATSAEALDPANVEALKALDAESAALDANQNADASAQSAAHMGVTHAPGEMCADVSRLSAEKSELVDQLQRLQAEFHNYRNRVEREASQAREHAADKLLEEFLTINDNLGLALAHAKDEHGHIKGDDIMQGLLLIKDQMHQLIEHQGVTEMPEGGQFDPRMHEALLTVEQKGTARGMIVQTFQRGYKRGERVMRPAKVSVAK